MSYSHASHQQNFTGAACGLSKLELDGGLPSRPNATSAHYSAFDYSPAAIAGESMQNIDFLYLRPEIAKLRAAALNESWLSLARSTKT